MRSVPLLALLGASFARGVSPEQRDLPFEDRSKPFEDDRPGIVERHENGFFAAQYPLTQANDHLVGKTSIGPNLHAEGIDTIDQMIISVETSIAQNSVSKKGNQANTHAILKRVPDFLTFNVPVYNSGFKTSFRAIDVPVTVTVGTQASVTFTKKIDGPVTVTVSVTVTKTATSFFTVSKTDFEFTLVPSGVTDEFLTFAYSTVTRYITLLILSGRGVYTTVTRPGTVTVFEGVGPTKTVTQTFTKTESIIENTFLPTTTRTVAIQRSPYRSVTTTTTDPELSDFSGFLWEP